jgi:N-methylhydantoinase B
VTVTELPAKIDPTTLAVIRGYLEEVVDEMDAVHVHSAFSPIITEMRDRANGIYSVPKGETVAQGRDGLPIFVGTMQEAVSSVLRAVAANGDVLRPGDVWMINEPALGGTHLQDAKLLKPFFWDGEPRLVLANTGHWMDVGSAKPGGFGPSAKSIFEEGVVYPPLRVVRDGELQWDVLGLIRANTRLPQLVEGDLRGQLNALHIGERRMRALFERYGTDTVLGCVAELDARSEQQMTARIEAIEDGAYEAWDALDNDGVTDDPVRIGLTIHVSGSQMAIDFEGTSGMTAGPCNMSLPTTITACYVGIKHLFPEIPINAGCFRPIEIRVPDGSMLAAPAGSAVGGYTEASARIIGLVNRALAPAIPRSATGVAFETGGTAVLGGRREDGAPFVVTLPYGGGHGGGYGEDGLVNGTNPIGMATYPSLELIEREFPLRWERFAIREGSGGAGQWRGGAGNVYRFRVLAPVELSVLGDRAKGGPHGILGGEPGAPNVVRYTVGGEWRTPALHSKEPGVQLQAGEVIELMSPGGGGYGPPADRSPALIERDERLGLLGDGSAAAGP